ncbi:hypothetical protein ICE98_02599 [Lactococcus lactis]|nr:hypothetical protein [Lactococcus lactis]
MAKEQYDALIMAMADKDSGSKFLKYFMALFRALKKELLIN